MTKHGMYPKYVVKKNDGSDIDPYARYFVLRYDKDPAAFKALLQYAIYVRSENWLLADGILSELNELGGFPREKGDPQ